MHRRTAPIILAVLLLAIISLARVSYAAPTVWVVDGDTIRIGGVRYRLFGIDAPEHDQYCTLNGQSYSCGRSATLALRRLITGRVQCQSHGLHRYGRVLAECFSGDKSLNAEMVKEGWAIAYRRYSAQFLSEEKEAAAAKAGMWAGTFQEPELFRHRFEPSSYPPHSAGSLP